MPLPSPGVHSGRRLAAIPLWRLGRRVQGQGWQRGKGGGAICYMLCHAPAPTPYRQDPSPHDMPVVLRGRSPVRSYDAGRYYSPVRAVSPTRLHCTDLLPEHRATFRGTAVRESPVRSYSPMLLRSADGAIHHPIYGTAPLSYRQTTRSPQASVARVVEPVVCGVLPWLEVAEGLPQSPRVPIEGASRAVRAVRL